MARVCRALAMAVVHAAAALRHAGHTLVPVEPSALADIIDLSGLAAGRETGYANTPTVVVVLVPVHGGLLMIRRALPGEGAGQLALPGGCQMLGRTWQEAGAAEVRKETGVTVEPSDLRVIIVAATTPDRRENLIFCESPPVAPERPLTHDAEMFDVNRRGIGTPLVG